MASTRARKPSVPAAEAPQLAPSPLIDRQPTVLGSNVSMQTVSSAFRNCQNGYRQSFVDLLGELIERDPHCFAVVQQRILVTAGGRLEIAPAVTEPGTPDEERAREIADVVRRRIEALPSLTESLASLLWGVFYGVAASEISWGIDADGWYPQRLHFIHSRRLAYPDPKTWDLHIWDQGWVTWSSYGTDATTQQNYGLVVSDYPGKFIVHTPQLRGDYPTRDGIGRELAYWMVLKGIAARGAGQYLERFAKPWVTGAYVTSTSGTPRIASSDDIAAANTAAGALGIGSIASAVLPDSVKLSIEHPTGGITQAEFISICDQQMSKAVVGQTLTTEVGQTGGNRALGQVQKEGAKELSRYDATCLAETLKRDLVAWIVKLNYPNKLHLTPSVAMHVNEKPDPLQAVQVAAAAVAIGMPVDADDLAERLGLKLIDPKNPDARRLAPTSPVDPFSLDPGAHEAAMEQAAAIAEATPEEQDEEDDAEEEPADDPENEVAATDKTVEEIKSLIDAKLQPARSEPIFAERNAAYLADVGDMRRSDLLVDQATLDRLAALHGVPPMMLNGKGH